MTAHDLSRAEARQSRLLLGADAVSSEKAVSIYQCAGLTVAGVHGLVERGLASKRIVRGHYSQYTAYWLTPAGVRCAARSAQAAAP